MSNIEQNKKRLSLDLIIICRANTLILNYYLTKKYAHKRPKMTHTTRNIEKRR